MEQSQRHTSEGMGYLQEVLGPGHKDTLISMAHMERLGSVEKLWTRGSRKDIFRDSATKNSPG